MGAGKIHAIVVLLLSFSILSGSVQAKYSGGSGEPNNPYLISTPADMNQIGRNYTDWDKCFKLTADINLSAYTGTQFSRIGTDDKHAFSGVFDGNGHTISGFTYTAPTRDYIGVFGDNRGIIENVSLVDVNITGRSYVGGLVGYLEGSDEGGWISNCNSTGVTRGGDNSRYIGGLVGCASTYEYWCYINNCYSTSAVTGGNGSAYLGGLVGQIVNGDISNCSSTGAVTGGNGSYDLGGLVGGIGSTGSNEYGSEGDISNCYSTGTVTGGDDSYDLGGLMGGIGSTGNDASYGNISDCYSTGNVAGGYNSNSLGGLVGGIDSTGGDESWSEGDISNCYSTGTVTGRDDSYDLGGLVGGIGPTGNDESYGNISDCYSTGAVSGGYNSDSLGGLVGCVYYGDVADCYATGEVTGDYDAGGLVGLKEYYSTITTCYSSGSVSGYMFVGGLVGWDNGEEQETTDSFWDTNTSGQSWSAGGTGKTTAEMMTKSTFNDAGWNFDDVWHICETTNYPKLLWQILPADLVCPDGVNFVDFAFFAKRWLNTDCASNNNCDGADFDLSGTVDIADLEIFCNEWLKEEPYHSYQRCTLTINIEGSGSVSKDPNQATYSFGETVQLTANPATGGSFLSWIGKVKNNTNNPLTIVMYGNMTVTAEFTVVADTTPPTPNPMTWAAGGEPNAISDSAITMTATTATDATSPPVEYFFTNVTDTGHDSGWQTSPTWTDGGLYSNTTYTYNVMARDSAAPVPNVTTASADANATTHAVADTTCPDPNPPGWASRPAALSDTQITMTATTETDAQGPVQYYFRNKTVTGHNSGWQNSPTFTDIGLTPDTNYGYTVKARDNALVRNYTAESAEANAVTGHDVTSPDPNPATFAIAPHAIGPTAIAMKATIATDASVPVWYQFYRSAPPGNTNLSAWQTDSNFTDTGRTENTTYTYQVRTKDSAIIPNVTAWSAAASATTSRTIQDQINEACAARSNYSFVTITIAAGTYNESIVINEPNIMLVSASGAAITVIDPGVLYQQAVEISGESVTIDGFTINHGSQAYDASHPQQSTIWVHANYSTIKNCVIDTNSTSYAGILIGGRQAGVPSGPGGTAIWGYNVAAPSKGHTIQNNVFHSYIAGESTGIFAVKLSDDSLISGNTFNGDANDMLAWSTVGNEGGVGTGIQIHSAAKGLGTHAVTIQNNTAQYLKYSWLTFIPSYPYNDSTGKWYEQQEDSDVNDVLVTGNTVHNIGTLHATGDSAGTGITFQGQKKSDSFAPGSANLTIDEGKVTIQSNTFSASGYGVWIKVPKNYNSGTSYGCVFDANHITIGTNNSISGNTTYGVYNGTVDPTQVSYHGHTVVDVNAVGNWWGDAAGPYAPTNQFTTGDAVDANVIYSPYRTTAP